MPLDGEGIWQYDESDPVALPTFSAFLNKLAGSVSARFAAGARPRTVMTRVKSGVADTITTAETAQKFETVELSKNIGSPAKITYSNTTGDFTMGQAGLVRVAARVAYPAIGSTHWINLFVVRERAGVTTKMRIAPGRGDAGSGNSIYIEAIVEVQAADKLRVHRQSQTALAVVATDSGAPATYVSVEYLDVY